MPSKSLLIEHFLKDLEMIAQPIESQAIFTHCVTPGNEGCLKMPAAVRSKEPHDIQADHSSRSLHLNGWLMNTSSGWRIDVSPPPWDDGDICVVATVVRCFTLLVRWARNCSKTSRLLVFITPPPGRLPQTFCNQINMPSVSIHSSEMCFILTRCTNGNCFRTYIIHSSIWRQVKKHRRLIHISNLG